MCDGRGDTTFASSIRGTASSTVVRDVGLEICAALVTSLRLVERT